MGLFTKDKSFDFEKIPSAPSQDNARSYLENLYRRDLDFPEREVEGLTPFQKELQAYTRSLMPSVKQTAGMSLDEFRQT